MRLTALKLLLLHTVLLGAAALTGCGSTAHGFDVLNKTGQTLTVEYLDVANDGTTKVYSTSVLAKDSEFANKVVSDELQAGKRVRFSLPDDPLIEGHSVTLAIRDEGRTRSYDLKVVNGRLIASELKKGRESNNKW